MISTDKLLAMTTSTARRQRVFRPSGISPRRRRHDSQVLHHALVPMLGDVAVHDEIADESLVARSQHCLITALQRHAVAPLAGKASIVRIVSRAAGGDDVDT